MAISLRIIGGELLFVRNNLLPLNVAQFEILTRSLFSYAAVIAGSGPVAKREVSSINMRISLSITETMSFM